MRITLPLRKTSFSLQVGYLYLTDTERLHNLMTYIGLGDVLDGDRPPVGDVLKKGVPPIELVPPDVEELHQ